MAWASRVGLLILPMVFIGVALGLEATCWHFSVLVFQNREIETEASSE